MRRLERRSAAMAVGLRFLLCDGYLAGDLWGPSSARDERLHVLFGRIIRGFERRVRILEPCDCLEKKKESRRTPS